MSPRDALSDEYVANVLSTEAKTSTLKYASQGLSALLPQRPTTNAPKPNTRFLKSIIKETDSHNAALKAKETQESRARLQELSCQKRYPRQEHSDSGQRPEHRHLHSKRRKLDYGGDTRVNDNLQVRDRERLGKDDKSSHRHDYYRSEHSENERDRKAKRSLQDRHGHHRRDHSERRRHRRGLEGDSRRSRDRQRSRSRHRTRSRSPRRTESLHDENLSRRRHRRHRRARGQDRDSSGSRRRPDHSSVPSERAGDGKVAPVADSGASDSDPLESLGLIGPRPPSPAPKVTSKGRGTFASGASSAIDRHFTSSYDPSIDVTPDDGGGVEDDWEQALEALRDRQRWQQQGAERLKQAGFSEQDIQKWEKGKGGVGMGGEGREEDVRWKKKGEGREWDRGKVVEVDGSTLAEADWGRLKGT